VSRPDSPRIASTSRVRTHAHGVALVEHLGSATHACAESSPASSRSRTALRIGGIPLEL
jgi:hypothetical protein